MKIYLKISELDNGGVIEFGAQDEAINVMRCKAITGKQMDAAFKAVSDLRAAFEPEPVEDLDALTGHGRC